MGKAHAKKTIVNTDNIIAAQLLLSGKVDKNKVSTGQPLPIGDIINLIKQSPNE